MEWFSDIGVASENHSNTPRNVVSQPTEPGHGVGDEVSPSNHSLAPSRTFNWQSLASPDGWEIAELGLGVEPYIAQGYQQLQNVNAADNAAQRSFAGHKEASKPRPRDLGLPNRNLATGGAISSASDQSLDHDVGRLAGDPKMSQSFFDKMRKLGYKESLPKFLQ